MSSMYNTEELELQLKISQLEMKLARLKSENNTLRLKNGLPVEEDPSDYADIGLVGLS